MKRVICVGAHPLDADLMGGPLLMKYAAKGAHCTMMHLVKGRLEGDVDSETQHAYQENLKKEMIQAAQTIGCDCNKLEYTTAELPSVDVFANTLVEYFEKEGVELVITHWRGTMHARHYYAYETVTKAIKILRKRGKNIKLLYGENCEDLISFIPQANYHMSKEELDQWFKALNCYTIFSGNVNEVPYNSYYRTTGVIRGIENGDYEYYKSYMYPCLIETI